MSYSISVHISFLFQTFWTQQEKQNPAFGVIVAPQTVVITLQVR